MKVLVTGGAGYIGSSVVHCLVDKGFEVQVIDDFSTGSDSLLPSGLKYYNADIGSEKKITKIIKEFSPNVVIHFAASVEVEESMVNPIKYYENNISKSIIFLQSCIDAKIKHLIFSSTAAIYGSSNSHNPVNESFIKDPKSPYGYSKLVMEDIINKLSICHNFNSLIFRYFNVAGADKKLRTGQIKVPATHLIKIACEVALHKRESLSIFGDDYETFDGTCIRDYIHIADLAEIHYLAVEYLLQGGCSNTLNCGYGRGFSVLEVVEKVKEISGNNFNVINKSRRAGDPEFLVANSDLCKKILKWVPKYDTLDVIIKDSLDWENKIK